MEKLATEALMAEPAERRTVNLVVAVLNMTTGTILVDKTGMALRFKTIDTSYAGAEDLSYEENVRHGKHASRTSSRETLDFGKKNDFAKRKDPRILSCGQNQSRRAWPRRGDPDF